MDTSKPGVSATDRKAGAGSTAKRNVSKRAAKKGGAVLEDSATKPSRKSTRRASGRAKRSSNMERRSTRAATAPKARAKRAASNGKKASKKAR